MPVNTTIFSIAIVLLAAVSSAYAQRGGTGGQMGFGNSGMGGMNGMSGGFGGLTTGTGGGMGGMGGGMGGFGTGSGMGGFGSSSLGGSGFGQSSMNMSQQNQGFIGRDSNDMAAIFNELGRNSNQFMQQLNRTMRRGNRGRGNDAQGENAVLPVRVRLDVAFEHQAPQPAVVAMAVRGRLEKLLTRRNITAPEVEVVGDTVVLRGVAPNESQRLVIEKLVSMEPGVFAVDNQMTIAEGQPSPPPVPPQDN